MSSKSISKSKGQPPTKRKGVKKTSLAPSRPPRSKSLSARPVLSIEKWDVPRYFNTAKAVYDLAHQYGDPLRQMIKRVTRSVGTSAVRDPPPARPDQVGPRDSTIHSSLEPVEGSDVGFAPSAVSETVSRYAEIYGNERAMRVKCRQPLCHFGLDALVAVAPKGGFIANRSATSGTTTQSGCNVLLLNPLRQNFLFQRTATTFDTGVAFADGLTTSDVALGFSMWRCCGPVTFFYEPQSSTASTVRVDFAFTDDPAHPVLGFSNANPTCPNVTQIDATATSVGFSPWNAWQMTVNPDTSWKYTYNPPYFATNVTTVPGYTANFRSSSCGAISCVVTGGSTADIYGRLMVEWELEFKDPAPLASLSPLYTSKRIMDTMDMLYGHPKGGGEEKTESKDPIPPDPPTDDARRPSFDGVFVPHPVAGLPSSAPPPPPPPAATPLAPAPLVRQTAYVASPRLK